MQFHLDHFARQENLIGGIWCVAGSGKTIEVVNPATGQIIGRVPDSGAVETRDAIEAADRAFATFKQTTALERSDFLIKLHDALMQNQNVLAELLTTEQGKPLHEAKAEIAQSAAYVRWFAEEARRSYGETIPSPWADRRIMITKEPIGVVAAITPWNFPSSMLARKIAPAIAAGCTVVVKPASQTPYSAIAWGVLGEHIGLPPGVINIVTGAPREIGDELCHNPLVRKITFTGSTAVGKILIQKAASTVKKVSMELGGNAPFIVFDDADLRRAVDGALVSKFRNSGQTCVCTNRFFVQSGIYEEFIALFAAKTRELKIGSGLEQGVQQGPLIDENAVFKVEEFVADAATKGGTIVVGGARHELGGTFFQPTVIANATSGMKFMKDEIFGPVAPVFRFETEQEAISLANETEFGLACYFYTSDLGRAFRVSEGLRYGMVGVNESLITTVEAPFGGIKESGVGREGGRQGLEEYFETKYVCVGGIASSPSTATP